MELTASGDVGGQKTLRSYWRNYFEKTDALIWVVDATDRLRSDDCREELHNLLQEEASIDDVQTTVSLNHEQANCLRNSGSQWLVCWSLQTKPTLGGV
mgnify:CR=1 FL=1